jgi:peptidoglycan/xylan/chitin deacetylase (PgdA/CDA1 family)
MSTIIKKWVSSIIFLFKKLGFGQADGQGCFRILLYHCVGVQDKKDRLNIKVSLENFCEQIKFLNKKGYNVLPLKELAYRAGIKKAIPPKSIAITFDDGYSENLAEILDILKQYNFTATFFVTTGYVTGKENPKKRYWEFWDFFKPDELKKLIQSGNDIGSHSSSHLNLCVLPEGSVKSEILGSKRILEDMLNIKIELFSYPYGKFNKRIKQAVENNGYQAACSSIIGKNDAATDLFSLRRMCIDNRDGIFEFEKKLTGCYDWLDFNR